MVTVTAFLVELVTSVVQLVVIFVTEVAIRDPISFVLLVAGSALTGAATGALGYLSLGAFADVVAGD